MRTLPEHRRTEIGGRRVLLCHGSPRRVNEFLWESTCSDAFLEWLCETHAADVLVCSHTGLPWHRALRSGRHVVNAGVIGGGTRANVVAEHCRLHVDVRSPHDETFDEALEEVSRIGRSATVDGITSTVELRDAHRPFEKTEASARLVRLAQEVAAELGFEIGDQATGGASDANTVAGQGVPTLDGLGPIGGDPHGPDEWLDLTSVIPRVTMLAALVERAGALYGRPAEPE